MEKKARKNAQPRTAEVESGLKLYISHPVTGISMDSMRKDVEKIKAAVRTMYPGCKVIVPEDCVYEAGGKKAFAKQSGVKMTGEEGEVGDDYWCWCMGVCIGQMLMCDGVVFHPDWARSRGCGLEMQMAMWNGRGVLKAKRGCVNWGNGWQRKEVMELDVLKPVRPRGLVEEEWRQREVERREVLMQRCVSNGSLMVSEEVKN